MKQNKVFSEKKEKLINFLQDNKEIVLTIMLGILFIGVSTNLYFTYFRGEEVTEEIKVMDNVEIINDAIFENKLDKNIGTEDLKEVLLLNQILKNKDKLTEEELIEINKRVDELSSKKKESKTEIIKDIKDEK